MALNSYQRTPKAHPEVEYPNERVWNGILIGIGAGIFVAAAGAITVWVSMYGI